MPLRLGGDRRGLNKMAGAPDDQIRLRDLLHPLPLLDAQVQCVSDILPLRTV